MKVCPNCGHENSDTGKFCEECGTKLVEAPKFCPECGTKLEGTTKFCPECGCNLATGVAPQEYNSDSETEAYDSDTNDIVEYEDSTELSVSEDNEDYEEYVDEDEYEEYETKSDKLSKVVDKYITNINKSGVAYIRKAVQNEKYAQIFQNLRSKIDKYIENSEIIGFIDTSITGNGKAGLVFTENDILEVSSGASWKLPYMWLKACDIEYTGKKITFLNSSMFNCGIGWLKKGMDISIDSTWYNIPALNDCINEIMSTWENYWDSI